ncbi:hypothetical protein B0H16DRAFT_1689436 [Mycena metata]|uniref:Uncharacterized protein n=1 Tax=Mycena metata TaxID=1033252 RepID=A0AAD7J8M9_9AGAR|nr:hypothetical protein B0H16DRAFT_1689436 [Mycena metata]
MHFLQSLNRAEVSQQIIPPTSRVSSDSILIPPLDLELAPQEHKFYLVYDARDKQETTVPVAQLQVEKAGASSLLRRIPGEPWFEVPPSALATIFKITQEMDTECPEKRNVGTANPDLALKYPYELVLAIENNQFYSARDFFHLRRSKNNTKNGLAACLKLATHTLEENYLDANPDRFSCGHEANPRWALFAFSLCTCTPFRLQFKYIIHPASGEVNVRYSSECRASRSNSSGKHPWHLDGWMD